MKHQKNRRSYLSISFLIVPIVFGVMVFLSESGNRSVGAFSSVQHSFPDRSSPQAMLDTFLEASNDIRDRLIALESERLRSGGWTYPEIDSAAAAHMNLLEMRMVNSLDLTSEPEAIRKKLGIEAGLMISEVLRANEISAASPLRELGNDRWLIEGTYLLISVMPSGVHEGEFVFSPETVRDVRSVYETVTADMGTDAFDAYRYYSVTPGGLLPPRWAGLIFMLPDAWRVSYGDNALWQWCAFGAMLMAVLTTPRLVTALAARGDSRRHLLNAASFVAVSWVASYLVAVEINLTGIAENAASLIFGLSFYLSTAALLFLTAESAARNIGALLHLDPSNLDTSMLRLFCRISGTVGGITVLAYGANNAGIPVMGIIASLGVGGLAVALAAQPTIENLFAGVVLFLDSPVRVGEQIESEDVSGFIEQIGMRSTRIRSLDGALISVTNSELAGMIVKNVSRRVLPENPTVPADNAPMSTKVA